MAKRADAVLAGMPMRSEEHIEKKLKEWNISREEYDRHQVVKLEREKRIPPVGAMATDFELELLSPKGERTSETLRLSSFRGKPVALAFGSYT